MTMLNSSSTALYSRKQLIKAVEDLANRISHNAIDKQISELFLTNLKFELADRSYEIYRDSIRAVKVERNRLKSIIDDKTNGEEGLSNQLNEKIAEFYVVKKDVGFGNGTAPDAANVGITLSNRNEANKAAINPDLPVYPILAVPTNPEDDGDNDDDENTIYDSAKYGTICAELLALINKEGAEKTAVVAELNDRQKGYRDTYKRILTELDGFEEEWNTLEVLRDQYKAHTLNKIQLKNLSKAIDKMNTAL